MNHLEFIHKEKINLKEKLKQLISPGMKYALLDFPDHSNVGDSAIWLGEIKLLYEIVGNAPSYVSTYNNFDINELKTRIGDGIVFTHGGGNFGDIYAHHQVFRECLIKSLPNNPIVQLPQSIKFYDPLKIKETASIIANHGNVHLMVRDAQSQRFSETHFKCKIDLAPDCAFGLGPLSKPTQPNYEMTMLLREDEECVVHDLSLIAGKHDILKIDWLEAPANEIKMNFVAKLQSIMSGQISKQQRRIAYSNYLANNRLKRGLAILSNGKVVVTDRLHAHILSILLGIPNFVLDNNYGKIHGYIDAWTADCDLVQKEYDLNAALRAARDCISVQNNHKN